MNLKTLEQKISKIENDHILKQIDTANEPISKYGYRSLTWDRSVNAFDRMLETGLAVKWAFRLKIFKDYNGKLTFDPINGVGHSYKWYEIVRKFDNLWVLNTYNYSRQTREHHHALSNLLKQLEIKFVCIEAPKGLQDLDRAMDHIIYKIAEMRVKIKYGRKTSNAYLYYVNRLKQLQKQLKMVQKLNKLEDNQDLEHTIKEIEENRLRKLERAKALRAKAKAPKPSFNLVVPQAVVSDEAAWPEYA